MDFDPSLSALAFSLVHSSRRKVMGERFYPEIGACLLPARANLISKAVRYGFIKHGRSFC